MYQLWVKWRQLSEGGESDGGEGLKMVVNGRNEISEEDGDKHREDL